MIAGICSRTVFVALCDSCLHVVVPSSVSVRVPLWCSKFVIDDLSARASGGTDACGTAGGVVSGGTAVLFVALPTVRDTGYCCRYGVWCVVCGLVCSLGVLTALLPCDCFCGVVCVSRVCCSEFVSWLVASWPVLAVVSESVQF